MSSPYDDLEKLAKLRDQGIINDNEFITEKNKILQSSHTFFQKTSPVGIASQSIALIFYATLGIFGGHRFYLKHTATAWLQLLLGLFIFFTRNPLSFFVNNNSGSIQLMWPVSLALQIAYIVWLLYDLYQLLSGRLTKYGSTTLLPLFAQNTLLPQAGAFAADKAFFYAFFFGMFGLHRIYVGRKFSAIAQMVLTMAYFIPNLLLGDHHPLSSISAFPSLAIIIWVLVDIIKIARGTFTDHMAHGLQYSSQSDLPLALAKWATLGEVGWHHYKKDYIKFIRIITMLFVMTTCYAIVAFMMHDYVTVPYPSILDWFINGIIDTIPKLIYPYLVEMYNYPSFFTLLCGFIGFTAFVYFLFFLFIDGVNIIRHSQQRQIEHKPDIQPPEEV
jgi:TM2 domain-containing membrane protein YozV